METTEAGWRRVLARPELARAWWLLPVASTAFVVARLWSLSERDRIDFRIYYEAVHGWQPGAIYDYQHAMSGLGFTYPPVSGLVLRPLTAVPYDVAELLWLAAGAAASLAFLVLAARHLPVRPRWEPAVPIVVAICMLTTPVWLSLRLGQINALLALAVLADVLVVRRRWSGWLVGFAGAIKLTPMYAVVAYAAERRWRAVAVAVGTFVGVTLAAWAWMPADSQRYWTTELFATNRVGELGDVYSNSARRLVDLLPVSPAVHTVVWFAVALAVTYLAFRRAAVAFERSNRLAAVTIVMCAGLAVAPITWSHHLYFLLPVVLLLIGSGSSLPRTLCAAGLTFLLLETNDPGQDATNTAWRAIALLLVVAFLPIDQADETSPVDETDADAAEIAPT